MKDFAHASFSPEKIEAMTSALQSAIDTLPEPVSSRVIHRLAEAILRAARDGESSQLVLQRLALLELQIGTGD
jgi:hypothetical protein